MFIPHCSLFGHQTVSIRYVRNHAGIFEVTANNTTIAVLPARMRRLLGVNPRVAVGCREITGFQADQLGFTVPQCKQRKAVAV
jgi:hypothetical protein